MEYETNMDRGTIINLILTNTISSTPVKSDEGAMYTVGEDIIYIMIQFDRNKNPFFANCINKSGIGRKYLVFNNPEDVKFINDSCKKRLQAQEDEKAKIEAKLQQEKKLKKKLKKEMRKAQQFKLRFGINPNQK